MLMFAGLLYFFIAGLTLMSALFLIYFVIEFIRILMKGIKHG